MLNWVVDVPLMRVCPGGLESPKNFFFLSKLIARKISDKELWRRC